MWFPVVGVADEKDGCDEPIVASSIVPEKEAWAKDSAQERVVCDDPAVTASSRETGRCASKGKCNRSFHDFHSTMSQDYCT